MSPLSLLYLRLNKLTSLSLSSYDRFPSRLIIFVALHWTLPSLSTSFLYSRDQSWTQSSRFGWVEWGNDFISSGDALVDATQHPAGFFAAAVHCSLILSLLSTRTPRSLSTELLPCQVDPSLCCAPGLCFSRF